jgi:hypothetical protein
VILFFDAMAPIPGATLILGAVVLLAAVRFLFFGRRPPHPLPPGPKAAPLIGNLHQMPKSLQWLHMYHWSKKYGPVMHLSMAGQPLIVLSSHQAAHDLLNRRSAKYSDRPRMVMAGELVTRGMHMLIRPYDDMYKLHQRMESPLLNLRAAKSYRPLQDMESRQLLFDVLGECDDLGAKGVNFHHHFERAMGSFIYSIEYGVRLKTGYEQQLLDGKRVQGEFARTGQVGAYIVDSFPMLNYLPRFLAPWKKEADELYQLEYNLHVGNLDKALKIPGWNFSKHMKQSAEAKSMSEEELAFDLGILADAGLDTSTVALSWFMVACIQADGSGWFRKARELLDDVVGRDRLPTFEDRPKLAYIDAIGESPLSLVLRFSLFLLLTCRQRTRHCAGAPSWSAACRTSPRSKTTTWATTSRPTLSCYPTPSPSHATSPSLGPTLRTLSPNAGSPTRKSSRPSPSRPSTRPV